MQLVPQELEMTSWSKFAFADPGQSSAMEDGDDKGASDKAMQHLQGAYDHIQKTIANVRKLCMALRKSGNTSQAALELINKAIEQALKWKVVNMFIKSLGFLGLLIST